MNPPLPTRVAYLNALRAAVSKRAPRNKAGVPLVSDFDLLCATRGEIAEAERASGWSKNAPARDGGAVGKPASNEIHALADCVRSLRELVALLEEPAEARPLELGAAVERAKAALAALEGGR